MALEVPVHNVHSVTTSSSSDSSSALTEAVIVRGPLGTEVAELRVQFEANKKKENWDEVARLHKQV